MDLKESEKIKKKRGGARPGSGRPKGSTDRFTVAGLLQAIESRDGRSYTEILAEDFVQARLADRHLAMKYHNLILNKVAANLTAVEVSDSQDTIEQRRLAFVEAMAQIASKSTKQ